MKIARMLFATDFSATSDRAARVAREIALSTGASLHVVHVVPPVTDPADSEERVRAVAREIGEGLVVESALLTGRVAKHLATYVREHEIDLLVLGTHGRTGVRRAAFGSVAEAVIRSAPCLVLIVPAAGAERAAVAARGRSRERRTARRDDAVAAETRR